MEFQLKKLQCEHRTEPLGIGNPVPRFSWQMESFEKGGAVAAYRLVVTCKKQVLWDSGRVDEEGYFAVYGGAPLAPCTRYDWAVTVTAADGSAQTASSFFETGFFSLSQWKGGWVSAAEREEPLYARTEFEVGSGVESARLMVASTAGAHGWTTLSMNCLLAKVGGKELGRDVLAFGRISPKKHRAVYRMYDVTDLLKEGTNVFTAVSLSFAFGACLLLRKKDGSEQWITFDADNLKVTYGGPYTLWEFGVKEHGGKNEYYNSHLEWKGWEQPAFDMSGWQEAVPSQWVKTLSEQPSPAGRMELMTPRKMWKNSYRRYVADFGVNLHGHIRLRFDQGDPSRKITVRYAEAVYPDGELDPASSINFNAGEIGPQRDIYIPRGEENEVFAPAFSNHGFRYAEILHYPQTPEEGDIAAWRVYSPVVSESGFSCSDEQINKLYQMSYNTQMANLATIPTDCPHRERLGWLGDALCVAESECLNFDMRAFYDGYWTCIEDEQEENGNVNYIAPVEGGGRVDIPFSTACVMIPWYYYDIYGDETLLKRAYPTMKKWIAYLDGRKEAGTLAEGVRWNDHTVQEKPDPAFMGALYYYLGVKYTAKAAQVLQKSEAEAYFSKAEELRCEILQNHWNGETFGRNLQADNALPLNMGVAQGQVEQAALTALAARVLADDKQITCGCFGIHNLIPALAERGRNDLVYDFCKDTRAGSWGGWIQNFDATTAYEYLSTENIRSRCHPFLMGSINTWFYEHLAGIKRTAPGFKTFRIDPYIPQEMDWAEGRQDTPYGLISFRWEKTADGLKYTLKVPCGTTATLCTPKGEERSLPAGEYTELFS